MLPDPHPLLRPSRASRLDVIRQWLVGTFVGRAFLVGASIKIVAFLLSLIVGRSRGLSAFDAIGDVALVAATVALGYRLYIDLKRRLLWRVRRKLIVSYIFIGFVPVLLVIAFFLVSGTLLFLNVSAYVLRNRIATVVDQTQFLAQTAAIEVQRAQNERELADTLARRQSAAERRYPMVSYAVVPAPPGCVTSTHRKPLPPAIAGPWSHMAPPKTMRTFCAAKRSTLAVAFSARAAELRLISCSGRPSTPPWLLIWSMASRAPRRSSSPSDL